MSKDRSDRAPAPTAAASRHQAPAASARAEIDSFLDRVKALGPAVEPGQRGRLIFALDATMSRQPTWDQRLPAAGRHVPRSRGRRRPRYPARLLSRPCGMPRSPWVAEPERLGALMSRIDCRGGHTQIGKVLAPRAARKRQPQGRGAGLYRRRHGGIARRSVRRRRRTWPAQRQGLHVPGRLRSGLRAGVSRDRPAHAAAPIAASRRAPRTNWPNCCARPRPMPPAA